MSRRHIIVWVLLAVLAIINYAENLYTKAEFVLHLPEGEAIAVGWATDLDVWLLKYNIEPVLAGLFLAVLFSGWIIPDAWPHLKARWAPEVHVLVEFHNAKLPAMVPPSGTLYTMCLLGRDDGIEPLWLGDRHGAPGANWDWGPFDFLAQKCTVTNYSKEPIFGVLLTFKVDYKETIVDDKNPGSSRSGEVVISRDREIPIAKLEHGHPFIFYIYNQGDKFANVYFPHAATFQRAGHKKREAAQFLPAAVWGAMVPPATIIKATAS